MRLFADGDKSDVVIFTSYLSVKRLAIKLHLSGGGLSCIKMQGWHMNKSYSELSATPSGGVSFFLNLVNSFSSSKLGKFKKKIGISQEVFTFELRKLQISEMTYLKIAKFLKFSHPNDPVI